MANLRDIERRIKSVSSTKQITRTMEMVATAKIKRATDRMIAARPYAESMVETLEYVASRLENPGNPLLQEHEELNRILIVAVASDRGMAGGFNSNLFRHVERLMRRMESGGAEVEIAACGKTTIGYFNYRGIKPVLEFRDLSADPTPEEAEALADYAIAGYSEGSIDEVVVVYNHTKNAAEQVLRQERVLPVSYESFNRKFGIDADFASAPAISYQAGSASAVAAQASIDALIDSAKEQGEEHEEIQRVDVIFEPDEAGVFDMLLPAYVQTTLYHALIDSAAAEQGARRTAMKAATDNATEMVESLSRVYNRVRQGAITTEITEIVGGAAALEE